MSAYNRMDFSDKSQVLNSTLCGALASSEPVAPSLTAPVIA